MVRVQASTSVDTSFAYACPSCGWSGRAFVRGEGWAQGDGVAAEADVIQDAEGAAWGDAWTTVELAPCPSCGASDRARWRAWLREQVVPMLAWGALGALVATAATFLLLQRINRVPLLAGAGAWFAVAIATLVVRLLRKRRQAGLLRFEADPDSVE